MGGRGGGEAGDRRKPYAGHGSLTDYVRHYADRAGIPESEFWSMTPHRIVLAFQAHEENLTRLAWRTALYGRVSHKHFPKTEAALFKVKPKPKRQSLDDQYRMAKLITKVMH
jgi:hypothetical protein